jgi:chemotaxis protein histidine kinase CheA
LVDVRRGFHTLKGSSRMVGFKDFGEAAWKIETLANDVVASYQPISTPHIQLFRYAQEKLEDWINELDEAVCLATVQPAFKLPQDSFSSNVSDIFKVQSSTQGFLKGLMPYEHALTEPIQEEETFILSPLSSIDTINNNETVTTHAINTDNIIHNNNETEITSVVLTPVWVSEDFESKFEPEASITLNQPVLEPLSSTW